MQWYYSSNGQQAGPVSEEEFDLLKKSGTIQSDTLVWRNGMPNWAPYAMIAASATSDSSGPGSAVPMPGTNRCVECGRYFPPGEMVQYSSYHVCAGCKPLFFQKLQEGVVSGGAGPWRYKKQLVTGLNAVLPLRCVKCNADTDAPQLTRKVYWYHPALYILLFSPVIFAIVALVVRKRSQATVSLCPLHRSKRLTSIFVAWGLFIAGFVAIFLAISNSQGWLAAVGALLLLGALIYFVVMCRLVYATKIDNQYIRLAGCGEEFLKQFPEWTGAR